MSANGRRVTGLVDAGGMYFSRAAAADGYVFLASPPVDEAGRLPEAARVKAPYTLSPSAHVRAQTRFIFERYREALEELGSSMEQMCQVEQYIPRKAYADGYIEVSRGPGFLDRDRPGSALMATGETVPEGAVIMPTGIAIVPGDGRHKELHSTGMQYAQASSRLGDSYGTAPPFSEIVTAGPYVFTTLIAADYTRLSEDPACGVHPEAKVDEWVWWGSEIRSETRFTVDNRLRPRMDHIGSSLDYSVHCTVYLTEIEDLFDFDLVWREAFPTDPPSRTVVPVRGLGMPRREDAKNHADGGVKMETILQLMRPGHGAEKEVVSTGSAPTGHESEAVRVDHLLWVSGQLAADASGPLTDRGAAEEVRLIFDRLEAICAAGGTDLSNLLRIRAFVTDLRSGYAVYAALRDRVPRDPPCVSITTVPAPLHVPGCSAMLDAVAYVP